MKDLDCIINDNYNLYLQKKQSNKLIICFSAAGGNDGNFTFYKTLSNINANVLFISFTGNDCWYANGINGFGDTLESSFTYLSYLLPDFAIKYNFSEIIFLGTSMGAYAALLFSHFIGNKLKISNIKSRVLAFGCETQLFLPSSKSYLHNCIAQFDNKIPDKYKDICQLNFFADEICLIFGEYFIPDCYCALKFRDLQKRIYNKHIKLISIKDCSHNVPLYINCRHGFIIDFFNFYLNHYFFIVNQGGLHYNFNYSDLYKLISLDITNPKNEKYLKYLLKKYFSFGFVLSRLGVLLEKLHRYNESYKYLYLSYLINNNDDNNNKHLSYVSTKIMNNH